MFDFFASVPRALESVLVSELEGLGASNVEASPGGVSFSGSLRTAYAACLWSRTASKILLHLGTATAATDDEVYEFSRSIDWGEHLGSDSTLAVTPVVRGDQFPNSHFLGLRVKDAIVDRLREETGDRPDVAKARPDVRVHVFADHDQVSLSIDLAGQSLHRRGYRLDGAFAPVKENLAAGLLLLADFPAAWAAGERFLDPMCGSGTFPIEAALIAAGTAPGLLRSYYGFLGWRGHSKEIWKSLLEEARERDARHNPPPEPFVGYDRSIRAVRAADDNAHAAGVADWVSFSKHDLPDWPVPAGKGGFLIANPPYGQRLGEVDELRDVYATIGDILKQRFGGWTAHVLSGERILDKCIGLRTSRRLAFFNGTLDCRLLTIPIVKGTFTKAKGEAREAAVDFANRLRKRAKHLDRWAKKAGVSCYRLYDADLPEYSVAVDRYEDHLRIQEYAAPKQIPPQTARARLKAAVYAAGQVLNIPSNKVSVRRRERQKGTAQYDKVGESGQFLEVSEGGLKFLVNLNDYLDTGLFLDHRITRSRIREMASGKRFLNLFAYTGSAAVYAAAGGATATTTVDMSRPYLDWASRNMGLNGFRGDEHDFVQANCLTWLSKTSELFDLIFLDPPTFSNSKRMEDTFDVQRDHPDLIWAAVKRLNPGGTLVFSTNLRSFKMNQNDMGPLTLQDISRDTLPVDFERNPKIHKCWLIRRNA